MMMDQMQVEGVVAAAVLAQPQPELIELEDASLTSQEVGDPNAFLESDRGKAWLSQRTANVYFSRWYDHQRGPYELKWCNGIADRVLEAKRAALKAKPSEHCPGDIERILEEEFGHGDDPEDAYNRDYRSDVEAVIERMAEELDMLRDEGDDVPVLDLDLWNETVGDAVIEAMREKDDSSVMDMLGSFDRCEITIGLGFDECFHSGGGFAGLEISQLTQAAYAAMGYTIGDYRRMTGVTARKRPFSGKPGRFKVRPKPLLTEDELRGLVDEYCMSACRFVLYAVVSLKEVVELDLSKPYALSRYSIAAFDPLNGNFCDISRKEAVVMMPGEGRPDSPTGYRPEDICGFHLPSFHAELRNV